MSKRPRHRLVAVTALAVALLAAGCVPPPDPDPGDVAPSIEMSTSRSGAFFSLPWPNEIRKTAQGTLDLAGLPGVERNLLLGETLPPVPILPALIKKLSRSVDDFGRNSAIYLQATVPLDPSSFPTPSETTEPDSPVQVVDLTTGELAPVIVDQQAAADAFRPANLLALLPYPGHPLAAGNRYAAIVTDGLLAADGSRLEPSPTITALDGPWDGRGRESDWEALRSQLGKVREVLASSTPFEPEELVAFTVFRTQDTDRDLQAVAAAVRADHPAPTLTPVLDCSAGIPFALLDGTIPVAQFQRGAAPHLFEGGAIEIGEDGRAVTRSVLDVEVRLKVPCGPPPPEGWPLLTYVSGSGAGPDVLGLPFESTQGWVVASIAPLFGEGRPIPELVRAFIAALGLEDDDLFYNLLNPTAARSNPIQQASEHLSLHLAASELVLDGDALGAEGPVRIDPTRTVISAQSQGAQSLPLVAAMAPEVTAAVSGAGPGGHYHIFPHLLEPRSILSMFTGDIEALDELNPIMQVIQTLVEASDGINFPSSMHYLAVNGEQDTCVPPEASRHLATAIDLDTVLRAEVGSVYGDPALDPPVLEGPGPYGANRDGSTRVNLHYPGGHFVAYENAAITQQVLDAVAAGETPMLDIPLEPGFTFGNCPQSRYDDPPRLFGR